MAVNWEVELIPSDSKTLQRRMIGSHEEDDSTETFFDQHKNGGSILESLSLQPLKTEPSDFMGMYLFSPLYCKMADWCYLYINFYCW